MDYGKISSPYPWFTDFSIKRKILLFTSLEQQKLQIAAKGKMENITASELAGFGVGTLLLCATIAAPKVDSFIATSQRLSLGLCKKCGGLKMIACSKCKGVGSVKAGGPFSFVLADESKTKYLACTNCRRRGHFCCPDCSKQP